MTPAQASMPHGPITQVSNRSCGEGVLGEAPGQGQLARADLARRAAAALTSGALVELEYRPEGQRHHRHPPVPERTCHLHGRRPPVEDHRLAVGQEFGGGGPDGRLGVTVLQGPDAVRRLLGAEEDAHRSPVDTAQAPVALQRLEIPPDGHLGASQLVRQLADLDPAAFLHGPEDHLLPQLHIHSVHINIYFVNTHMPDVRPAEALPVEAVVFDLGGVLLDWDPRHLYRKLMPDEAPMEHFLATVCTPEWHEPHDRGVPAAAVLRRTGRPPPRLARI